MEHISLILITLGGLLLLGLAADALGRFTPLPRVSLLMLFGFIISHSVFDLLPTESDTWFAIITDIALSMVAFLLGGKLSTHFFRQHGTAVLGVSVIVTLVTFILVAIGVKWMGLSWENALLLGAIATATDPAAVSDVIHELKTKNSFTQTLIGIVAIDDVWGIIVFSITLAFIQLTLGTGEPIEALLHGSYDLLGAVLLGVVLGFPMAYLTGHIDSGDPTISEAIGMVFLCSGLAKWLDVSFLLSAMTMGAVIVNLAKHHKRPFHAIKNIEWPFLSLFFVLAGASIELGTLKTVGWITIIYIIFRLLARQLSGKLGAQWMQLPNSHQTWIGTALMPQAGVAIGMVLVAKEKLPSLGEQLLPIVITATILFELIGPIFTRLAIKKTYNQK